MGRETHAVEILTKEFTQGRAEEETKIIYQKKKKENGKNDIVFKDSCH